MALGSLTVPCVGAMAVREPTRTRIPSKRSSCSSVPLGSVSAAVSVTGAGRALPVETSPTVGDPAISVAGGLKGSCGGTNSWTMPRTCTRLPTAAAAGGALPVKTKIPSEVAGSWSLSALSSGVWMKKPLLKRTAVTTPCVVTI